MKRALSILLFAFVTALAQEHGNPDSRKAGEKAAHAESGGHGADPMQLIWKWVNFAILAGGLGYLAVKTGGPFFRERTVSIQKGIKEAAAMKADAEARAAEIDRRVSNLSADIERLRTESKQEIAAEGARMRAETEQALAKVTANAETEIASAAKLARHELKVYSAQLALEMAAGQIQKRMSSETQDRLVGSFVKDLQAKGSIN